jgi:hypothetical protein
MRLAEESIARCWPSSSARVEHPRHRREARSQLRHRAALVAHARSADEASTPAEAGGGWRRRGGDVRAARGNQVRTPPRQRRLALRAMSDRGRRSTPQASQGAPCAGVRRAMLFVRVQPMCGVARVPSPRSGPEAFRHQPARHFARPSASRGSKVRPAVCELPCRGRSRRRQLSCGPQFCSAGHSRVAQLAVRGSSIGRAARC